MMAMIIILNKVLYLTISFKGYSQLSNIKVCIPAALPICISGIRGLDFNSFFNAIHYANNAKPNKSKILNVLSYFTSVLGTVFIQTMILYI